MTNTWKIYNDNLTQDQINHLIATMDSVKNLSQTQIDQLVKNTK
jgi:hypothetical protein